MHPRPAPRRPLGRVLVHTVAALTLAAGGVLLTGGPTSAAAAERPDSFGGEATASALHVVADRNPQPTPVTDLFHVDQPYATTAFDSSGGASATAASLYPGPGLLGVPALLCQFRAEICSVPLPPYPFIATADYPTKQDASATTSSGTVQNGPLTVAPQLTVAHAGEDRVEATTRTGGNAVTGVLSAGSSSAHSAQSFEGSTLVVTSESVVSDLAIGTALHVDQVRSVATSRITAGRAAVASATTTVSGATVGGVPVTIDADGVHVAGNGDSGAAKAAVNTALAALDASGIEVRTLVPTRKAGTGQGSASTSGLLVTFARTVSGVPEVPALPPKVPAAPPKVNGDYAGSVTLAGAGVTGFADVGEDFSLPVVDLPGVTEPPPAVGGASTPGAPTALAPVGQAPVVSVPGAKAPTLSSPTTRPTAVLGVDLSSRRLKALCLVLLGYPLLVLLSAPLRAPARLPRA